MWPAVAFALFVSFVRCSTPPSVGNFGGGIPFDQPCFDTFFTEDSSFPPLQFQESIHEHVVYDFVLVWILMFWAGLLVTWAIEYLEIGVYLPESAGWLLLGSLVGLIVRYSTQEDFTKINDLIGFRPEFFLGFILPVIIFEAGWNLGKMLPVIIHLLGSCLLYAIAGTLISMCCTFAVVYGFALSGYAPYEAVDAMALSILIAATDPVATLSVYSKLGAHIIPHSLCFGESILNDALAIVVFRSVATFFTDPEVSVQRIGRVIGYFILALVASFLIGLVSAMLVSFMIKYMKKLAGVTQILLITVFAFLVYRFAEMAELSGVFAIFFYGIFAKHYAWFVMTEAGQNAVDFIYIVLKDSVEMFIFILLGTQIWAFPWEFYNVGLIFVCLSGCLVGRFLNIYPLTFLLNLKRDKNNQITQKMQFLLWWAGLRGAVAYSLALSVPFGRSPNEEIREFCDIDICHQNLSSFNISEVNQTLAKDYHYREAWGATVTTTIVVIYITLLGFGASTGAVLKVLKLSGEDIQPKGQYLKDVVLRKTGIESKFLEIDRKYIIPFLSSHQGRTYKEKQIRVEDPGTRISFEERRNKAEEMLTRVSMEAARMSNEHGRVSFDGRRDVAEQLLSTNNIVNNALRKQDDPGPTP